MHDNKDKSDDVLLTVVLVGLALFYIVLAFGCNPTPIAEPESAPIAQTVAPIEAAALAVVAVEPPLVDYVAATFDVCRPKLSEARRAVLVRQVARVAAERLRERRHAEGFVALLCIESRFDAAAKSTAGAVGLAQLMPAFAPKFATDCGLGKLEVSDLQDSELNLQVGACHFQSLLDQFGGNVALALAAYNSGAASTTTAKLGSLGSGNPETMGYVARHAALREAVRVARGEP